MAVASLHYTFKIGVTVKQKGPQVMYRGKQSQRSSAASPSAGRQLRDN
jgi:hypothetical protein